MNQFVTVNEDGSYRLVLGDLVFPKVVLTGEVLAFGADTMSFRIAPPVPRPAQRARFVSRDPDRQPGPILTDISAEIRMTPLRFERVWSGLARMDGLGRNPGGGENPDGGSLRGGVEEALR